MAKRNLITLLISVLVIVLLIDILIRIWFGTHLNLRFDAANFNNILTPCLTIVATVIYACALANTIRQNKIILSQSIKPYYEKEIENTIEKVKSVQVDISLISQYQEEYSDGLNYIQSITNALALLGKSKQYLSDYEKSLNGNPISLKGIENREYYKIAIFLNHFSLNIHEMYFRYQDIKMLIEEINDSKLVIEEKLLLKKRIKRTLLAEYMAFIEFEDNYPNLAPMYPVIFNLEGYVTYENLSKTAFRQYYDLFKNELGNL